MLPYVKTTLDDYFNDVSTHEPYIGMSKILTDRHLIFTTLHSTPDKMKIILRDYGGDPNIKITDDGDHLIYICVRNNWEEKIKLLLDAGANPNVIIRAHPIGTLLGYMLYRHHTSNLVRLLLEHGADPNQTSNYIEGTPLDIVMNYAPRYKRFILMQYGATKCCHKCNNVMVYRTLIVCDMILYIDDDIPSDWIIEIKGCLY